MSRIADTSSRFAGGRATTGLELANLQEITSFTSYPEAEAAVDALADEGFPVEHLAIVADGLEYFENVTGRRGYVEATLSGAASGVVIGALIGFFLGLLDVVEPLVSGFVLAFWGAVLGGIVGAIIGAAGMRVSQGRNFVSIAGVRAERYVVLCDPEVAAQAVRLLGSAGRAR